MSIQDIPAIIDNDTAYLSCVEHLDGEQKQIFDEVILNHIGADKEELEELKKSYVQSGDSNANTLPKLKSNVILTTPLKKSLRDGENNHENNGKNRRSLRHIKSECVF